MKPSQKDTTIQMLRAAGKRGVHTFELRRAFIGNPSQRIAELIENDGHDITTGPRERLNGEAMGVRYFLVDVDTSESSAVPESRRAAGLAQAPKQPSALPDAPGRQTPTGDGSLFDADAFTQRGGHWEEAA